MNKKVFSILIIVFFAMVFAACGTDKTSSNAEPDISGEVLDIQNDTALRVLVDADSDFVTGQVWVSVTEDTIFVDADGQEAEPDDIESLFVKGERAAFLSTGEIMESYPMQARALIVFIK